MVTHSHAKHRDRMRERVLKEGADGLAKHELLEMLLYGTIPQKNTNDIAHNLLNEFGSLTNLIEADPKEIQKTAGIGINSAIFLSLLHELIRRYDEEKLEQKTVLSSSSVTVAYCRMLLGRCVTECFYVICLDARNRIIHTAKIAEGTVVESAVFPRMVVEVVLRYQSVSVVVCHNHPSGRAHPSHADMTLTGELKKVFDILGVRFLDHIIIGEDSYYSFFEGECL